MKDSKRISKIGVKIISKEEFDSNKRPKKETSLIKIDSKLYAEVTALAQADPITYPSIKNFVEQAIKAYINSIKYNIENKEQLVSKDWVLRGSSKKGYVQCLLCDHFFLNDKTRNKEGKRVCPRCTHIVGKIQRFL